MQNLGSLPCAEVCSRMLLTSRPHTVSSQPELASIAYAMYDPTIASRKATTVQILVTKLCVQVIDIGLLSGRPQVGADEGSISW